MRKLPHTAAEDLLELVMRRYPPLEPGPLHEREALHAFEVPLVPGQQPPSVLEDDSGDQAIRHADRAAQNRTPLARFGYPARGADGLAFKLRRPPQVARFGGDRRR